MQVQPLLENEDKLPAGFRDNATIVSDVLKQAALKPGIYFRKANGKISPAFFGQLFEADIIPETYRHIVKWPNVDIVYDQQLDTCFAKHGSFLLKCFQDGVKHEEPSHHFVQNGSEQKVIFTTWPLLINASKKRVLVEMWSRSFEENFANDNDEASLTMACLVMNSSVTLKAADSQTNSINLGSFPVCVYTFKNYDEIHHSGYIAAPAASID